MSIMKQKMLYAIIVIVIIAVVIVGFAYFSPVGKMICGPCGCFGDECVDTLNSCSDSDGGLFYTTKGTVSGYKNKIYYSISDTCVNVYNLTEYYCSGTSKASTIYTCTSVNKKCLNGACVDCSCSDGTTCSQCSTNKPKYCNAVGNMFDKCSICGCPSGQSCNTTSDSCYTPCNCSGWTNVGCGHGCNVNQMNQTRTCTPYGCAAPTRCISDPTCTNPDSCADTDGGLIWNVTGTASGYKNNVYYNITDFCPVNMTLVEYYCSGTAALNQTHSCYCVNGRCY